MLMLGEAIASPFVGQGGWCSRLGGSGPLGPRHVAEPAGFPAAAVEAEVGPGERTSAVRARRPSRRAGRSRRRGCRS